MKIAQITWIAYTNFGTSLQALALQRVLGEIGHEATMIDDNRLTDIFRFFGPIGLLRRIKHPRIWATIKRYRRFADKYLKIDRKWVDANNLSQKYEAFVCGSDQIWSPLLSEHFDGFYFAGPMRGRKVAYAPSLGAKSVSLQYRDMMRPWLSEFNALSCREAAGAKILSEISGRKVETVLDPTLLLTGEEWKGIFKPQSSDRHYLLAYFLTFNERYLTHARKLADKMNLTLAMFATDKRMRRFADIWIDAGPEEFVQAISGCDGLITDSFHGTIFGLHFHRPLLTVKRFRASAENNQNSRIENLFGILGITDNFPSEEELTAGTELRSYDYAELERRLDIERQRSLNYLQKALC